MAQNKNKKKFNLTNQQVVDAFAQYLYDTGELGNGESTGELVYELSENNGATVVVCETLPKKINEHDIVFIKVKCSKTALYTISSNFYDNPSSKIDLIGVTGTNGKTTITSLLHKLYNNQGIKSGLISTINIE